MTIKAVVDTNVVVSGIFWKGNPLEILRAWQDRRFTLVVSLSIMEEYRRVLAEMTKLQHSATVQAILQLIELHAEMVEPILLSNQVCTDRTTTNFSKPLVQQVPTT